MAQSQNKYSRVKEAIARLSHHMIEEDIRFGVSQKRVELVENCDGLATIEESYFTAILCHAFLEDLARRGKPTPFHEFIDTPSRPTEHALGSDISLGQYNSIFRIRIMHKVLRRHWCDQPWHEEYKFSAEGAKERTGDYGHLLTLLEVSVDHPNIVPYLAINVAFCVHDYRRMGFLDGKLIPLWMETRRGSVFLYHPAAQQPRMGRSTAPIPGRVQEGRPDTLQRYLRPQRQAGGTAA